MEAIALLNGVYSNLEDVKLQSIGQIKFDDPDVERVRRAHLNDLENIPAFWVLGALYASTAPRPYRLKEIDF
ncbi:Microsomal glutathione S-transferase 1 [Eumeta japonica]|uniref:Microsomal glutathione S-transferase 1 n=1 Tax=Eumeta variegata TaxID=151549 RepID=A0A4C1YVB7_EUMVA|nr:Microsomal glutathione S-transferase 1 [Eumeta japonica]